jgi:hypothetical protein
VNKEAVMSSIKITLIGGRTAGIPIGPLTVHSPIEFAR